MDAKTAITLQQKARKNVRKGIAGGCPSATQNVNDMRYSCQGYMGVNVADPGVAGGVFPPDPCGGPCGLQGCPPHDGCRPPNGRGGVPTPDPYMGGVFPCNECGPCAFTHCLPCDEACGPHPCPPHGVPTPGPYTGGQLPYDECGPCQMAGCVQGDVPIAGKVPMTPKTHCVWDTGWNMTEEKMVEKHGQCPGYPYKKWKNHYNPLLGPIGYYWCCESAWDEPPHRVTCEQKCQGDFECVERCRQMEGWIAPKTKPQPYRPAPTMARAAKQAKTAAIKAGIAGGYESTDDDRYCMEEWCGPASWDHEWVTCMSWCNSMLNPGGSSPQRPGKIPTQVYPGPRLPSEPTPPPGYPKPLPEPMPPTPPPGYPKPTLPSGCPPCPPCPPGAGKPVPTFPPEQPVPPPPIPAVPPVPPPSHPSPMVPRATRIAAIKAGIAGRFAAGQFPPSCDPHTPCYYESTCTPCEGTARRQRWGNQWTQDELGGRLCFRPCPPDPCHPEIPPPPPPPVVVKPIPTKPKKPKIVAIPTKPKKPKIVPIPAVPKKPKIVAIPVPTIPKVPPSKIPIPTPPPVVPIPARLVARPSVPPPPSSVPAWYTAEMPVCPEGWVWSGTECVRPEPYKPGVRPFAGQPRRVHSPSNGVGRR